VREAALAHGIPQLSLDQGVYQLGEIESRLARARAGAKAVMIPRTKNGDPVHIPLNVDDIKALMIFRARGNGSARVVWNQAGQALNYPDALDSTGGTRSRNQELSLA